MDERKIIDRFPRGVVTPPPSKSLCHRAAICSSLAEGESVIENVALSDDIAATLNGVRALGADWALEGTTLRICPGNSARDRVIDCGESGSTLRFLIPLAMLGSGETVFTGQGRLMRRPLDAYMEALGKAGGSVALQGGRLSVRGPINSGLFCLPGDVSSQYISGLLFALPLLEGDSEIRLTTPLESRQYVELTIDVMRQFGVEIQSEERQWRIRGGQRYRPARYAVEADYSQAAFFLAAAALGCDVACTGLNPGSRQGDRVILDLLREAGADIAWEADGIVRVRAEKLRAVTFDATESPDLVPPVAALCCFCEGVSRIVNAARLRHKESDRLRAMVSELTKLGARVEEGADSLTITGAPRLPGGRVDAWGDHRIAMAMALAAVRCDGPVALTGHRSVSKSYPDFWADFEKEARYG